MPDTHATLEAVSDEALARRIAGGLSGSTDAEEAELYRRFAPRVRLYGRRHLQNDTAAGDLAQDVLLLTIERLRAGAVRRPEQIGSFILGTSRMMAQSERRVARRREALTARYMWTAVETGPSSLPRSTRRASRRACARSLSGTGLSCCSRSTRTVKRLESRRISVFRRVRSTRSGIERWHACATACWGARGHEGSGMRADRARRSD